MKALRSRGQTLVLFVLTLLLLTLMVLLTISFGLRVRERMELQTLADAAAYSEAVAAARTFNVMAVMNRTEWSLLVAQTATQAYISWSSAYLDSVQSLRIEGAAFIQGQIPIVCTPLQIPAAEVALAQYVQKLNTEYQRIDTAWDKADIDASAAVRNLNSMQAVMQDEDFYQNYKTLEDLLKNQTLASTIVSRAQGGSPWKLTAHDSATDEVNSRETSRDCKKGVACDPMPGRPGGGSGGNIMHQYEIYMGSRGDAFTTGRAGGAAVISAKLNQVLAGLGFALYSGVGSSYRSDQFDGPQHGQEANPGAAQSDDHGTVSFFGTFGGCPITVPGLGVQANVLANLNSNDDRHTWGHGTCRNQSDISHSLIGDIAGGNWPIVIDYNDEKANDQKDRHGQPKLFSLIQRDYGGRTDGKPEPYQLAFTFKFTPSSNARFDNRGIKTKGGEDIQMQTAMATGMAYYHRGGDWTEPPNFMNPFWRATLVPPDIDDPKLDDLLDTLGKDSNMSAAQDAAKRLDKANFKGWQ